MSASVHQNSSFSTLTPVQAQVVAALAQGTTITAAAQAAGIHRTTIHNWLRHQREFAAAVREARRDYAEALRDQLDELSAIALSHLRALLEDPNTPPAVRLKACLAVLQRPRFPDPGWSLPEPVEPPEKQQVIDDFAMLEAEYRCDRVREALDRRAVVGEVEYPPAKEPVARNAPCPCGSGFKYKRCCGRDAPPKLHAA